MRISGPELGALSELLVKKTEDGPVVEWVERIAVIARKAGIQPSRINWNQSPINVAFAVVTQGNASMRIDDLRAVIDG